MIKSILHPWDDEFGVFLRKNYDHGHQKYRKRRVYLHYLEQGGRPMAHQTFGQLMKLYEVGMDQNYYFLRSL